MPVAQELPHPQYSPEQTQSEHMWLTFIRAASILREMINSADYSSDDKNALCRSAASRAYYAAYHLALHYATEIHPLTRGRARFDPKAGSDSHRRLVEWFQNNKHGRIKNNLEAALRIRHLADYSQDLDSDPETIYIMAFNAARDVIYKVDELIRLTLGHSPSQT